MSHANFIYAYFLLILWMLLNYQKQHKQHYKDNGMKLQQEVHAELKLNKTQWVKRKETLKTIQTGAKTLNI